MPFLGRWEVDDLLTFPANTHSPSTGAATDADSSPVYRIYEDETGTPILTGSMALLDSTNTAGFYSEQITLSAANGFEVGKCYTVYVAATVGGITSTMAHTFQVEATLATASALATVQADTDDIQTRLPAALVSGRIDASVGAMAANVLTATAINADAITDAKVASDVTIASVTGAVGSVTGNVGGNVVGSVASVTAGVTVTTNNDKTGYGLSAAAVQAIWDALTSALTTVGSIGKRISDNLDAAITSRMATFTYTTPPTVVAIRTEMDSNSTKLANLDAAISTRASQASVDTVDDFLDTEIAAIKAKTDNLPANTTTTLSTLQTSVDDVPTNAELTTALGTADDATLAAIAALNNLSAAGVRTAIGLASANLDTQLDALPTNAELATSQAAADDATLAAIAALNNLSAAQVNTEVDTALADYDAPTHAELTAELATADDATLAAIAGISSPSAITIADAVLSRGVSNVENTADTTSLAALILATFESSVAGTVWTIRKSAGGTFVVKTVTVDAAAQPVTGVT